MSTSDNASVPNVKRTNYDITYVEDDDYADLISTTGEQGDQIKLDDSDVCREVRRLCEEGNGASVIVVEAMGEIAIASCTELLPIKVLKCMHIEIDTNIHCLLMNYIYNMAILYSYDENQA